MLNQALESKTEFHHHRLLALVFLSLFVILIIVAALFFLPSAQVIMVVSKEPYNGEQIIKIDKSVSKEIVQLDTVPGLLVNGARINKSKYFFDQQLINQERNQILTCRLDDLNHLFREKIIDASLVLKKPLKNNFDITGHEIISTDLNSGLAVIKFFIKNELIPDYNFNDIRNQLINRSAEEGKKYLKSLPNVQGVRIYNSFYRKDQLPSMGERIKIRLDII